MGDDRGAAPEDGVARDHGSARHRPVEWRVVGQVEADRIRRVARGGDDVDASPARQFDPLPVGERGTAHAQPRIDGTHRRIRLLREPRRRLGMVVVVMGQEDELDPAVAREPLEMRVVGRPGIDHDDGARSRDDERIGPVEGHRPGVRREHPRDESRPALGRGVHLSGR